MHTPTAHETLIWGRARAIDRTRARTQTSGNAHPIPTIYQTQFLDRPQMLAQPMSARVTHRGTRITMSHIPLRRTCSLGPQTGSARRGSPKRRRQKKNMNKCCSRCHFAPNFGLVNDYGQFRGETKTTTKDCPEPRNCSLDTQEHGRLWPSRSNAPGGRCDVKPRSPHRRGQK